MRKKVKRDGITIDPEKVKAISKFTKLTNITELRSYMGLVNQFGDFSHEISKTAAPLRELLSKNKVYQWLQAHSEVFEATKKALSNPPTLMHFDPKNLQLYTPMHHD